MNQEQNNGQYEKDLITADEVQTVVNGNMEALIAQLERAKQVALEQLQAKKNGIVTTQTSQKSQEELEAELLRREAELNAAVAAAKLNQANQNKGNVNLNIDQKALETRVQQVENDIQNRTTPIDTTRILSTENVVVSNNASVNQVPDNKPSKKELKMQKAQAKKLEQEQKKAQKQKQKELRKANSNFKYFLTALLFIALIVLVNFLPEISNYIAAYQANKAIEEEVITSGVLTCELDREDDNFDYQYVSKFYFSDSKLEKLNYKITTRGDKTKDLSSLEELNNNCNLLRQETKNLSGVVVKCSLSEGINMIDQTLSYKDIDIDMVSSIYAEASGIYPNYKYQDSIDRIQTDMNADGYNCVRNR